MVRTKRQIVYDKCDGHCGYCGDEISYTEMQIDHIIPQSKFEKLIINRVKNMIPHFLEHLGKNDKHHIDNLMPSCEFCNNFKDNSSLEMFRARIAKIINREPSLKIRIALKFCQIKKTPRKIVFYFERNYNHNGEHSLFEFLHTEERWFLNWVVMRRQYKVALSNVQELTKDVQDLRKRISELEDLKYLREREKIIEDFNRKNNKKIRYKKKPKRRK